MSNTIIVTVDGGIVQSILAAEPSDLKIIVVDYDCDGETEEDTTIVEQGYEGRDAPAIISTWTPEIDPEWAKKINALAW